MPTEKPQGIRAQKKAERPGEILREAFAEFVDKGFIAARVEDIAKRIGVTKGTVYFYFETKERLFEEVMVSVSAAIASDIASIPLDTRGTYVDQLKNFILSVYGMLAKHPEGREMVRLLIAEAPRFPELTEKHHDHFIGPGVAAIKRIVTNGIAAGEFTDSALADFPQLVMSPILVLTFGQLRFAGRRPIDPRKFIEAHLELVINGLRVRS